jgi:hypothetical protein
MSGAGKRCVRNARERAFNVGDSHPLFSECPQGAMHNCDERDDESDEAHITLNQSGR